MDDIRYEDEDESTEYDEEADVIPAKPIVSVLVHRNPMDYLIVSMENYNFSSWEEMFPKQIDLISLMMDTKWQEFLVTLSSKSYFAQLEENLDKYKAKMVPPPELLFNAFNLCPMERIKVVILGQDPYINPYQACGLSFSVPHKLAKPPSLDSIYRNLLKHGHISDIPSGGCLSAWALQGCLMINTAFTTVAKQSNAHKNLWKDFTNDLLTHISNVKDNVVFLVWGKEAHLLCYKNVNPRKHYFITSSHPSSYSCHKEMEGYRYGSFSFDGDHATTKYSAFDEVDHFGMANAYLKSIGKPPIIWNLIV